VLTYQKEVAKDAQYASTASLPIKPLPDRLAEVARDRERLRRTVGEWESRSRRRARASSAYFREMPS
jgi:hypothetical protein